MKLPANLLRLRSNSGVSSYRGLNTSHYNTSLKSLTILHCLPHRTYFSKHILTSQTSLNLSQHTSNTNKPPWPLKILRRVGPLIESQRHLSSIPTVSIKPPEDKEAGLLATKSYQKQVAAWLLASSGLVLGMVLLGGYTRLTGSGLSITDWSFRSDSMPLSADEWNKEFERYKQFPEFSAVNSDMTVDEFKGIYFIEWAHRMAGRITGGVFAAGAIYFAFRRAIKKKLALRILGLLSIGATQGLVGWWMVRSGLETPEDKNQRPKVSPLRLMTHLSFALVLYSGLIWNAMTLLRPSIMSTLNNTSSSNFAHISTAIKRLKLASWPLSLIILTTLASGALVAGNDAGRAYNTWPKMYSDWIPPAVYKVPENLNLVHSDTAVVQFNHRYLAYTTLFASYALFGLSHLFPVPQSVKNASKFIPMATSFQVLLGILTLLTFVPTELGVAHQFGSVLVLTSLLNFLHAIRFPRRPFL